MAVLRIRDVFTDSDFCPFQIPDSDFISSQISDLTATKKRRRDKSQFFYLIL
jgi:hypothetical protein